MFITNKQYPAGITVIKLLSTSLYWEIFLVQLMTYTDFEKKRWLPLLLAEISNGKIKIELTEIYL
jgi:hypothetical protein